MKKTSFIKSMLAVILLLAGAFCMTSNVEASAGISMASAAAVVTVKRRKYQAFQDFLTEKGISGEAFEAKTAEEQEVLLKENSTSNEMYLQQLEEKADSGISKEEVEKMKADMKVTQDRQMKALQEASTAQGKAIKQLLEDMKGPKISESETKQIHNFIAENADKIKQIKAQGSGVVEFSTSKSLTTGSATNPGGIPAINGVHLANPTQANLRGSIVDGLVTNFTTSLPSYPYTETIPTSGDYGFVAEAGVKPEVDFTIETRYAEPKKIAAHIVLTDESVEDIPGLQSIATGYLRQKHDLKRQSAILGGTGTGNEPTGAIVYASPYSGVLGTVVDNPNFMDVVNALITDIYTDHNYQDEMPYMANLVLVHPHDFYSELVAAKDADGRPLYPMASLFNQVTIGNATIIPYEHAALTTGNVFVADMSKYMVGNYVPYTVRIGFINDQLITNQFTMVGESRLFAFVRTLDQKAFRTGRISTIKAAIAKP